MKIDHSEDLLRNSMDNKFRILLVSDLDYEEMVADICYQDDTVATITQEKGVDKMEIELFPPFESQSSWKFNLEDFLKALQNAKKCLIESTKLPD